MGIIASIIRESLPPAPRFTTDDTPDLTGKVMIVTGGNAGIGKETARVLLAHNAKVYIACRSAEKAKEAASALKQATGKTDTDLVVLSLDLADLGSIKASVAEFLRKETRLDVLFNSGGVMAPPISQTTKHGHDLQFGTNVLGHFYLTQLLLPTLVATAKASPDGIARVVNTSSMGHWFSKWGKLIDYDTLTDGPKRLQLGTSAAYSQSKSGNILFARELARRYGDQGIVSTALNPGNINSDLQRHFPSLLIKLARWLMYDVSFGAITQIYAGTSPETANINGEYLIPWARVSPCRADHQDAKKQEELWEWLETEVKKYAP